MFFQHCFQFHKGLLLKALSLGILFCHVAVNEDLDLDTRKRTGLTLRLSEQHFLIRVRIIGVNLSQLMEKLNYFELLIGGGGGGGSS